MSSPLLVRTFMYWVTRASLTISTRSTPLPIRCCTLSGVSLLFLSSFLSPCPLLFLAALIFLGL
jgi:hypothetical protein